MGEFNTNEHQGKTKKQLESFLGFEIDEKK